MRYEFCLKFTEPILGMAPCDPEVYKRFIASDKRFLASNTPEEVAAKQTEEIATVLANVTDDRERGGWDVFHKDEQGLLIYDNHVRGFLKAAAEAITGKSITAYKSKIDKWVFVFPRRLHFFRVDDSTNKQIIIEPDGVLERAVRCWTMQGPRTSLKRSDRIDVGAFVEGEIEVLPLGEKDMTEEVLRSWFAYGKYSGISEWRNGGYGRFDVTHFKKIGK